MHGTGFGKTMMSLLKGVYRFSLPTDTFISVDDTIRQRVIIDLLSFLLPSKPVHYSDHYQWRIQDFPAGRGKNLLFCQKLDENERN